MNDVYLRYFYQYYFFIYTFLSIVLFKNNKISIFYLIKNKFRNVHKSETFSREFISTIVTSSQRIIEKKLNPYLEFSRRLGNMYTPSLYAQLINVIYK